MNSPSTCRWGILGTAEIARKNWRALQLAPNATLKAVASRSLERSQEFVRQCQQCAPSTEPVACCGSYQELLDRSDIDAVYIPLPTQLRHKWMLRAIAAGKHILAEKPTAVSASHLEEVLQACREKNLQFMDGVMFMHSDRLELFRQRVLDDQGVGPIKRITTHHAFAAPPGFLETNIRADGELEPQGCLGDLGWYSIRFILWLLPDLMPDQVDARILTRGGRPGSSTPVPLEMSAELSFPGGISAHFYCSFLTENQQWVNVGGTQGYATISDFVLPFVGNELEFHISKAQFQVEGCDFNMERYTERYSVAEYGSGHKRSQETKMFQRFSQIVLSGKLEPYWPEIALRTQMVMDACLESASL